MERVRLLQRLVASCIIGLLMPKTLRASNRELILLGADLAAIVARLPKVSARVTIPQGQRDTLLPASTAGFLSDRLTGRARPRKILMRDGGPYLPCAHPDILSKAICYTVRDGVVLGCAMFSGSWVYGDLLRTLAG